MAGRHSKAKHRLDARQDEQRLRRTIHMVDLRTGLTHLLTADAAAADLGRPPRTGTAPRSPGRPGNGLLLGLPVHHPIQHPKPKIVRVTRRWLAHSDRLTTRGLTPTATQSRSLPGRADRGGQRARRLTVPAAPAR